VTKIALPAPFAVSTDIAAEPDGLKNAIIALRLGRLCVLGLTLDFALNLKQTSLNGCWHGATAIIGWPISIPVRARPPFTR
jgi:hypothetical protein